MIAPTKQIRDSFLGMLCCPDCHGELQCVPTARATHHKTQNHVGAVDAVLRCACGTVCPIVDGVPRLLQRSLVGSDHQSVEAVREQPPLADNNSYDHIRQSFSREWAMFDYDADKTWGWTIEERKKMVLTDLGLSEKQLKGKVLLDAGCGNGTLTAAISNYDLEVVGIDLNDRLTVANANKHTYAGLYSNHVHFVQGNVASPPLKSNMFDFIYCSGVLHHTPSSYGTFVQLVPLLKSGGRMYVWVYSRRSVPVRIFMDSGRQLKRFMTLDSLAKFCRLMAPVYKLGTETLNALGVMDFRKRDVRGIALDLFDAFAPRYNHRHTEEEVQEWFRSAGFENIQVSVRHKQGFGVIGDKL